MFWLLPYQKVQNYQVRHLEENVQRKKQLPFSNYEAFCRCRSNSTGSYPCPEKFHLACSIICLNLLAPGRKMLRVPSHLLLTVGVSHYILLHSRRHKLNYEIMLSRLFHQPGNLLLWQGQIHTLFSHTQKHVVIENKIGLCVLAPSVKY